MLVFFSVLYNPDDNALINIRFAKSLGILPVVFLNKVDDIYLNKLLQQDVVILGSNINVGLGLAFNELEIYLKKKNHNFFVYFDQDTKVNQTAWTHILDTYKYMFEIPSVGLLHYGHNTKTHSKLVTSSGSLFSLRILNEIGFHDKSYFVEGVDYEICLRLNLYDFKILNVKCLGVDHMTLQDGFKVNFLCKKFTLRVYGKNRTTDFNISHIRLLKKSISNFKYYFSLYFLKSLFKHNILEFISRIFIKLQ